MNDSNDAQSNSQQNLDISNNNCDPSSLVMRADSTIEGKMPKEKAEEEEEEEELRKLLLPDVEGLPETPRSAVETNFTTYFAPGKRRN